MKIEKVEKIDELAANKSQLTDMISKWMRTLFCTNVYLQPRQLTKHYAVTDIFSFFTELAILHTDVY